MLPEFLTHFDPGPHSTSNEQVFPVVWFGSRGAVTGCRSLVLPGNNPPMQTP
jgi:hypothetical protein